MKRYAFLFVVILTVCGAAFGQPVVYVDSTNTDGPWDGLSWESAFETVQDGIDTAGGSDEVWVAAETYPEEITLASGVSVYGGFDGSEENLSERDIDNNPTVIDATTIEQTIGAGTGTGSFPLRTGHHDARIQVIYLSSEVGSARAITSLALDVTGLPGQTMNNWTIRMKHTSLSSYPIIFPIWESTGWTTVYQNNETVSSTGWVTFNFSTPFQYNGTDNLMIDFSFNNSSYTTDGYCRYSTPGGNRSLYAYSDSFLLWPNPLTWSAFLPPPSVTTAVPNIRLSHQADHAVLMESTTNARIDGFTITGGNANGVFPHDNGGGILSMNAGGTNTIANCAITGNQAARGGGVSCDNASPSIANCTISGNDASLGGGMACLNGSSPAIVNCTISGNYVGSVGGAVECVASSPIITNCTISANEAATCGGVSCVASSSPLITNTIFEDNTNHAIYEWDAVSDAEVTNCLFHNNPDGDYYDIDSATTYTGADDINSIPDGLAINNVDGDPLFVNKAAGDFHLRHGSPAIDMGGVAEIAFGDGTVTDTEPNDTIETAQNIDSEMWNLDFSADIGDTTTNTSQTIQHVTILGTGNETFDVYSFTVANAADSAIFDIDYGTQGGYMDSYLYLYDSDSTLLTSNDDNSTTYGQGGSVSGLDSYIQYTFPDPGTYYIRVGRYPSGNPVPAGADYQLQISLENHEFPTTALPTDFDGEPRPTDVAGLGADGTGEEYDIGADEYVDSDDDGLSDAEEIVLGTDPDDPDTDNDGANDGDEVDTHGTDPLDPDSDDDGLPDGWEVDNEFDPNDDTGDNGADGDPDGDGFTNLEEYEEGYDPQLHAPIAAFSTSSTSGVRPLAVDFTDASAGEIISWSWDLGDGYDSTDQDPSHTYYFVGDYTVTLTITGPGGIDSATAAIQVDQALAADARAYKATINGILVKYSKPTCFATYNDMQDNLLIAVWGDEPGVLTVVAKEDAPLYWNDRCDIVIDAPDTYIKKIIAKGIQDQMDLYVCGQVGYVKNFILKDGYVGNTLHYGEEFGLGSDAMDPSKKVLIKRGATTAPVLGIGYPDLRFIPASAEEALANLELEIKLKSKPFYVVADDEVDEDAVDDEDYKLAEIEFAEAEASVETKAAYVADIDGVKVRYSKAGCVAYYNDTDDTLTVEITDTGGDLLVKCGEDAYLVWDDSCDLVIDAPDASINTMILKGNLATQLHVVGNVGYVNNFKLKYGTVGDTEFYGLESGLGCTSLIPPNKILLKWGWTTAPLLGVSY